MVQRCVQAAFCDAHAHVGVASLVWVQAGGVQARMKPAASLSLVLYTAGLPIGTFLILLSHRRAIHDDQTLRMKGLGSTRATNPNYHVRRRFEKLYRCVLPVRAGGGTSCTPSVCRCTCARVSGLCGCVDVLCSCRADLVCSLFRPEMSWWRLVLFTRKFCIVSVALMFSSTPLFQAWYAGRSAALSCTALPSLPPLATLVYVHFPCVCVRASGSVPGCSLSCGVIFVSYALHVKYQPYAVSEMPLDLSGDVLLQAGTRIVYVFNLNGLESLYLVTSFFILLAGESRCFGSADQASVLPGIAVFFLSSQQAPMLLTVWATLLLLLRRMGGVQAWRSSPEWPLWAAARTCC